MTDPRSTRSADDERDAIEVARHLQQIRLSHRAAVPGPRSPDAGVAAPREEIR